MTNFRSLHKSYISACSFRRLACAPMVKRLQSNIATVSAEVQIHTVHDSEITGNARSTVPSAQVSNTGTTKLEKPATSHIARDVNHEGLILSIARSVEARVDAKGVNTEDRFDWARDVAAFGLLEHMLASGKHPSTEILESTLKVATNAGNDYHIQQILAVYEKYWLRLGTRGLLMVSQHYCDTDAPEQCLAFFERQLRAGETIPAKSWLTLLEHLFKIDAMDVALKTLERLEGMAKDNHQLMTTPATLYLALTSFTDAYHLKGTQWAWRQAIQQGSAVNLDEGTCTRVLNVCSRLGLPILATEVVQHMDAIGIEPCSQHYAALIESYCVAGDVKNAFMILTIMRQAGIPPTSSSAAAILNFMSRDAGLIDRGYFTLQDLKAAGSQVDITALNAIIDACVLVNDMSRAVATFQDYKVLAVQPNIDTLNSLLTGCVGLSQKELALSLVKLFREELAINADARTYTLLISVCTLQDDYEDAFRYLEEMKEEGHQPPKSTYEVLVRRCVSMNDPRAEAAYDELKGFGYRSQGIDVLMRNKKAGFQRSITAAQTDVFDRLLSMTESKSFLMPRQ